MIEEKRGEQKYQRETVFRGRKVPKGRSTEMEIEGRVWRGWEPRMLNLLG